MSTPHNDTSLICQVTLKNIQEARQVIQQSVRMTPILDSVRCSEWLGHPVFLKMENFQATGSFKIRGATYKISRLAQKQEEQAVMAISAGNHAQGIALASSRAGIPATVFMPENAPLAKIQATRGYGAEVLCRGQSFDEARQHAMEWLEAERENKNVHFVSPFDDDDIIAGQGSCGLELLEQLPEVDTVVVPVGGGGLISGMAIALKALKPKLRIVGVQTESVPSLCQSFWKGEIIQPGHRPTLADGIAIKQPAQRNFEVISHYVDDMITVSEESISRALFFAIQYKHVIAEGAGVVGLAALMEGKLKARGPTVIVISGGNIDVKLLDSVISKGMSELGRILVFKTLISDTPGSLREVLNLLAHHKANVSHIQHARFRPNIPLDCTEIEVEVEIRNEGHAQEILQALKEAHYEVQRL